MSEHPDIKAAQEAIEAILAAIPDEALPEFDRVEFDAPSRFPERLGMPVVWWGGSGHVLGTAKRNGKRDPLVYRTSAAWDAIQAEMCVRADRRLLDNGDDPTGVRLAVKGNKR